MPATVVDDLEIPCCLTVTNPYGVASNDHPHFMDGEIERLGHCCADKAGEFYTLPGCHSGFPAVTVKFPPIICGG